MLASYFFSGGPQLLTEVTYPRRKDYFQFWTQPFVQGERYLGRRVYVLTSRRTFSAGEAFAYAMKHLKRATLVGDRTAGAANPNLFAPILAGFDVSIPIGESKSPITGGSWEGVGVQPDVAVSDADALRAALELAQKAARRPTSSLLSH